jgi:Ribbon-helix-helix protein, copG family
MLRCMPATRTQVYFTEQQRKALDELAARERKTLAELVREAVDVYLARGPGDPEPVLDQTFGSIPDLQVPARSEWDRGYG